MQKNLGIIYLGQNRVLDKIIQRLKHINLKNRGYPGQNSFITFYNYQKSRLILFLNLTTNQLNKKLKLKYGLKDYAEEFIYQKMKKATFTTQSF